MMLLFLIGTHASANTLVLFLMIRSYRVFLVNTLALPIHGTVAIIGKIQRLLGYSAPLHAPFSMENRPIATSTIAPMSIA